MQVFGRRVDQVVVGAQTNWALASEPFGCHVSILPNKPSADSRVDLSLPLSFFHGPYGLTFSGRSADNWYMGRSRVPRKATRALSSGVSGPSAAGPGSVSAGRCPPDASQLAESLWLGKLDAAAAQEFLRHCRTCPECARVSAREREVIRLIRAALAEEPPDLMFTSQPVIVATRWPIFTDNVQSQIVRNQNQAVSFTLRGGPGATAHALLTFRWFHYRDTE